MNSLDPKLEEIISVEKLCQKLDFLIRQDEIQEKYTGATDTSGRVRGLILQALKEARLHGLAVVEAMLMQDGAGTLCAMRLCYLMDSLITILHEYAVMMVYPTLHSSKVENHMALIAVGGYGRGTLAPGSDIDLLFLLPHRQTPWSRQLIEYILYMFWDMGLKVGYATRTLDESIHLSRQDITVRTATLEARFLCGNHELFHHLAQRFDEEVVKGSGPEFIQAKLAERDTRHQKVGATRYLVEPNVKDGKGGQRDLHTLFWIAKYFYRVHNSEELVKVGVLSSNELKLFHKAENFLWTVRCHMHFLTGKTEERLSFDLQKEIAHRLNYTAHPGQYGVERFMKHYFLVAKNVGDLTRIICAALEEKQAKHVPGFNRIFLMFSHSGCKNKLAETQDFVADHHRLNIAHQKVFVHDPVNLIRMFHFADKLGMKFHPEAMQQATRSLKLITSAVRENPEANRLFLEILTSQRNPELILRRMNESGVLGRFIPDFGKIVAMMQFNMYHHYTVDEHLLRCIGTLCEIEHGVSQQEHPLANMLMPTILHDRHLLYIALLLHDIAKGRVENHSIAGAKIARRLCPRFGLNITETETVSWLVQEHLTMGRIAQSRDLNDRKTIEDFAAIVQTLERMKLLLILTICDIKAVGPGVWNGWKGQLLRTLFYETERMLTNGFSAISHKDRTEHARSELAKSLSSWPQVEYEAYLNLHDSNYFLTIRFEDQLRHAQFIRDTDARTKPLAIMTQLRSFEAVTEITVLAPDHPRLLSVIAGACAGAGANIVDAQIFTTNDERALDIILINHKLKTEEDEKRRAKRIGKLIEDVLLGHASLPAILSTRTKLEQPTLQPFSIEPRIVINNTLSKTFTVIEVEGLDRPGLLSELTGILSDLSLDIASAHITTFGEKVIDTFYITDLVGNKILNPTRQTDIKSELMMLFGIKNTSMQEPGHAEQIIAQSKTQKI